MNTLEDCQAYISYVDAMILAGRLPMTSSEYLQEMQCETELSECVEAVA